MKVYKFGGASVRNAAGIRNLMDIVGSERGEVMIVVSAMGKTTNALERVARLAYDGQTDMALQQLNDIREYHYQVVAELYPCGHAFLQQKVEGYIQQILQIVRHYQTADYDEFYDQIVSFGELISTRIVAVSMHKSGMPNEYIDMTETLVTDGTYREAIPQVEVSAARLQRVVQQARQQGVRYFVAQGFIGGTAAGKRTTLGREGSDYSAALLASMVGAESVTIWKDVAGVLNADPRRMPQAVLLPELSYAEAVELAYSGAQVIHPKTIRPLANSGIRLFVRPFADKTARGTVIYEGAKPIDVPVYIWRDKQVLVTFRAKDFAFVLEECLSQIFEVMHRYRLKVSLIQSSAVTVSVSIDKSDRLSQAVAELAEPYRVTYNEGLSLLTIRGATEAVVEKEKEGREVLLSQTTRRTARLLIKGS